MKDNTENEYDKDLTELLKYVKNGVIKNIFN